MSLRNEQCNKVCRILDDVLANRPTERDALIVAVRTAFEEPKWIPCQERLPEEVKECIVWMRYADTEHTRRPFFSFGWVDTAGRWLTIHEMKSEIINVIAWMPLPPAYREEGEKR